MRELYRQMQNNSQKINWKKTTKKERSLLQYHSTGFISSSLMKTDMETGLGSGDRPFLKTDQRKPGPGEYNPNFQLIQSTRQFKIREKSQQEEKKKETPGPSSYQLPSSRDDKKGFSITGKKKQD